jgi:hypothetical protein
MVPCILQSGEGVITSSNQFQRHLQYHLPVILRNLLGAFPYLRLHEYYLHLMHTIRVNYGEGHAQKSII